MHELLGLFSGEVSIWESTVTIFTTMIIKLMEDRSLGTLFYDLGQGGLNLFFLTIVGHTIPFSFFGHSISVSVCYNWSSTNAGHNNIQHHLRFSWLKQLLHLIDLFFLMWKGYGTLQLKKVNGRRPRHITWFMNDESVMCLIIHARCSLHIDYVGSICSYLIWFDYVPILSPSPPSPLSLIGHIYLLSTLVKQWL